MKKLALMTLVAIILVGSMGITFALPRRDAPVRVPGDNITVAQTTYTAVHVDIFGKDAIQNAVSIITSIGECNTRVEKEAESRLRNQ